MRLEIPKDSIRIFKNINRDMSNLIVSKIHQPNVMVQSREDKLNLLLDSIECIKTNENGSMYIKFKEHVVIETGGSLVKFSMAGDIIDSAKTIHLNPKLDTAIGRKALADMTNITNDILK